MKDGSIVLYVPKRANVIQKAIQFFTGMPQTHAAIYFEGYLYEESMWGAQKHLYEGSSNEVWEPKIELRNRERRLMGAFLKRTLGESPPWYRWPYNYLKLLVLALVYPTRWIWNKLNWVPFQNDLLGEVCSTYVDQAWLITGRDIIPGMYEEFTVPGDLSGLPGFERV